MSVPVTQEQALLSHVNELIKLELSRLPSIASHLIPGMAGYLAGLALGTDFVQAELATLVEKGVDVVLSGAIHEFNNVQAAVLAFIAKHPMLKEAYDMVKPATLTGGQYLGLAPDEAKAVYSMVAAGRRNEVRAVLGLKPV